MSIEEPERSTFWQDCGRKIQQWSANRTGRQKKLVPRKKRMARGTVAIHDWTQISYARAITRLKLDLHPDKRSIELLRQALLLVDEPSICPRLRRLDIPASANVVPSSLLALFASSVDEVNLDLWKTGESGIKVINAIRLNIPQLHRLSVQTPFWAVLDPQILNCIATFQEMKTVSLDAARLCGWSELSKGVVFEDIYVSLEEFSPWKDDQPPATFPSLHKLRIRCAAQAESACRLVDSSVMPRLRTLRVETCSLPDRIVNLSTLALRSPLLEEIGLVVQTPRDDGLLFESLGRLAHLQTLDLRCYGGDGRSLEDVNGILIRSLPSNLLRLTLDLRAASRPYAPLRMTRQSFVAILRHCTALRELEVSLDLTNVHPSSEDTSSSDATETIVGRVTLQRLVLSAVWLDASGWSDVVIRFLLSCCPGLQEFGHPDREEGLSEMLMTR